MEKPVQFSIKDGDICRNKHGGIDTSVEANAAVRKARDRELIYGYIKESKHYGHTLDELSVLLNRPPNAISGRITELKAIGKIVASDRRRATRTGCNARVYTIPVY